MSIDAIYIYIDSYIIYIGLGIVYIEILVFPDAEMVWLIKTPLRQREFWLFLADFNWNQYDLGLITVPDNN